MRRIDDGHQTLIAFTLNPGVRFWEKEVTPPGLDGGGENDTTTMRNSIWRTRAPKHLITLTPMTFTAAYDPIVYQQVRAMINRNQEVIVDFPDLSFLTFWGWLDKFIPNRAVEGAQPTAEVTVVPSNQDNNGIETEPIFVNADV